MAEVDPDDDTIERFLVFHYRFDPQRSERRHVLVAAYDNQREFNARMKREVKAIERRRSSGEPLEPGEHISGAVHEPGYARRAANGHLLRRAQQHGVGSDAWLDSLELPGNISLLRSPDPQSENRD
ncbi:hypothetical protein [Terrabacter sp. NPDC080008]|uniref:hypothetical protein n=1 Tax=Terrabacter sp. NPDC080008 TaxID=3155176 RepID=UPI00344DAF23